MSIVSVIGSGFSGLSAATYLATAGYEVHVFEKNSDPGGRARQLKTDSGYTFDMGPSWYWMPDVFEKYFNDFGLRVSDMYNLKRLDPAFDVVFGKNDKTHIPDRYSALRELFESIEPGSAKRLDQFMEEAEYKYKTGMESLVYKPGISITEFADLELMKGVFRLQVFSSFAKHVRNYFTNPKLIALMEFPILFLGAMPEDTPALYSLMNYAGLKLGTFYPEGGFGAVVQAMVALAKMNGVQFHFDANVEKIETKNNETTALLVNGELFYCDAIVAAADYHHVETKLLPAKYRNYTEEYWSKKTFAPSSLIFYLGFNKKIPALQHHTLFFDEDFTQHSKEIYTNPQWPTKPLFYACCASRSDETIVPAGHESIFLLMPIAPGLKDSEELREKYFQVMMKRLNAQCGEDLSAFIDYKKSYCVNDFIEDYNSYKGNAYGLANTLMQTAILKPKIRNKHLPNLFYTGQLTVPGPGVPPSLISGKIAAEQVIQQLSKKKKYESII
jgi:phytoene desaturase